ncbi:MAG: exo-alpha-sialidase, partial [Promethearchaeota archaeon]
MKRPFLEKEDIFLSRTDGYHTYRIPAIVSSKRGTILVFAEARKLDSDWAPSAIVMKRSFDGGISWEPMKILISDDKKPVHNPVPIVSNRTNSIHLLFCYNYKKAFYMQSCDDGASFTEPQEITDVFDAFKPRYKFRILATGPGHGIQLKNGRLIVPVWLARRHIHRPSVISVIYSDDEGDIW